MEHMIAVGKDLSALLRDFVLLLIGGLLLLFPAYFNDVLVKAGFEEGSIIGLKWKAKLVQADEVLKEANVTITNLRKQLEETTAALVKARGDTASPEVKAKLEELESENRKAAEVATNVGKSVKNTLEANAPFVQRAQMALNQESTKWGVIFGGDTSIAAAQDEIKKARSLGFTGAQIFYRQESYRSVAVTESRAAAEQALPTARSIRQDSYIVNLDRWCPRPIDKGEYLECVSS